MHAGISSAAGWQAGDRARQPAKKKRNHAKVTFIRKKRLGLRALSAIRIRAQIIRAPVAVMAVVTVGRSVDVCVIAWPLGCARTLCEHASEGRERVRFAQLLLIDGLLGRVVLKLGFLTGRTACNLSVRVRSTFSNLLSSCSLNN